jgi:hypothetical protein
MVRKLDPITGCGSGFKAAGKVCLFCRPMVVVKMLSLAGIWCWTLGWCLRAGYATSQRRPRDWCFRMHQGLWKGCCWSRFQACSR